MLNFARKEDWGHCPGEENPVDLGSRRVLASGLKYSALWWKGPRWLSGHRDIWPVREEIVNTSGSQEEIRKMSVIEIQTEQAPNIGNVINLRRYSSLKKLIRVTALVKRSVSNLKARLENRNKELGWLKAKEIVEAERDLKKAAQVGLKTRKD